MLRPLILALFWACALVLSFEANDDIINANSNIHEELSSSNDAHTTPPTHTYFAYQEHEALLHGHIALMTIGWFFILPIAVMLLLARHHRSSWAYIGFLFAHGFGLILGTIYNSKTPDLYPKDAHHKLGWALSWIASAQFMVNHSGSVLWLMSLLVHRRKPIDEEQRFIPLMSDDAEESRVIHRLVQEPFDCSFSNIMMEDSASKLTVGSSMPSSSPPPEEYQSMYQRSDSQDLTAPRRPIRSAGRDYTSSVKWLTRIHTSVRLIIDIMNRALLVLGFVAICTGIATLGRFFEGKNMLNGLAHWIKGGVFAWLGIFTLGRWSGAFGEIGWAWNVRPIAPDHRWRPSAELIESALIFFYGATNIFLEHLSSADGKWTARDLEHVSITVLFIGGGLCGMLVESSKIQKLLNTAVLNNYEASDPTVSDRTDQAVETPDPTHLMVSMNPLPALVIMFLGIMMSSHKQDSELSTIIHKQWGNLLIGSSFTRGLTYVMMYLRPPSSIMPSRPPTELLTAFGLISGGIIFMASSTDTVEAMEQYGVHAMFINTVILGFVGLLMAWVLILLAIKGWASRKRSSGQVQ